MNVKGMSEILCTQCKYHKKNWEICKSCLLGCIYEIPNSSKYSKKEKENVMDKALTLEEVEERACKPVWIVFTNSNYFSRWALVNDTVQYCLDQSGKEWDLETYDDKFVVYDKEQFELITLKEAIKKNKKVRYIDENSKNSMVKFYDPMEKIIDLFNCDCGDPKLHLKDLTEKRWEAEQ